MIAQVIGLAGLSVKEGILGVFLTEAKALQHPRKREWAEGLMQDAGGGGKAGAPRPDGAEDEGVSRGGEVRRSREARDRAARWGATSNLAEHVSKSGSLRVSCPGCLGYWARGTLLAPRKWNVVSRGVPAIPIAIRSYRPEDWEAICRVHDRARPDELRGSFDARAFIPLAEDPEASSIERCEMFVAELERNVIAFAGTEGAYLAWLYVDPAHYRRGIGRALLRHCMARLQGEAGTLACGNTRRAIALYESEGFVIGERLTGENAGYRGPSARLKRRA